MIIIPAKFGSTRLPRKNFLPFYKSLSLLQISIIRSVSAQIYPIIISSENISEVHSQINQIFPDFNSNIKVVKRPLSLSKDPSTIFDVLKHARNNFDPNYQHPVVSILPTSPFNSSAFILAAYKCFSSSNHDRLLSLSPSSKPPFNAWYINNHNDTYSLAHAFPDSKFRSLKSTECPQTFHSNGCISIYSKNYFGSSIPDTPIIPFLMDGISSVDIDHAFEFSMARLSFSDLATDINLLDDYIY